MSLKAVMFCILVILLVDFVYKTVALDQNGDGVCLFKFSTRHQRKKSYNVTVNKWCGRRKCMERRYKNETYLTWTNRPICCKGWNYDSDRDICKPICSTNCIGGRCVSPDQCQCLAPAYLDPDRPNTCITPVCDPTCVNADCHANNTCICKTNFSPYNSTHCFKCDQGYTADENLECVPICEQPCINSICTAPNTCTCNDGFKHKNSSVCEPKCDCINGECVAPNECSCHKGYVPVNKTVCAPKCNGCTHGDCVAPSNCSCHSGYDKIQGVCKPKCANGCVNGFCTAPNVCSCRPGYVKSNRSASVCVKPCDGNCKGYCDDDGACVKWNCSEPIRPLNACLDSKQCNSEEVKNIVDTYRTMGSAEQEKQTVCCDNYEYDGDLDTCLPICHLGCINGNCIDVDTCVCTPPLTLVNHACVRSLCDHCDHGDCMAPNDCRCHRNYIKSSNNTCIPKCDFLCVNGECAEPNKCKCKPGYKPDPNDSFNCLPICDPECVNASCISHNECLCMLGYKKTAKPWICKPTCNGCDNGQCIAPYNCTCNAGYDRVNSTCKPKCSSCINGDCVAPGKCQCRKGYVLKGEDCSPKCSRPCNNGWCSAPDHCTCHDGYNMTDSGCEPTCAMACTNGRCSAPNHCTCHEGYQKSDTDHYFCFKSCNPLCVNGTCDSHGKCNCFTGFEFDNDTRTCKTIKHIDCSDDNANKTLCEVELDIPAEPAPNTMMAGLDLTLISIGGACLLLLILVIVVMQRIWHKRKDYSGNEPTSDRRGFGSVVYTVPHTLIQPRTSAEVNDPEGSSDEEAAPDTALRRDTNLP